MSASTVTDSSIHGSVKPLTAASANGTDVERDNLLAVAEVVVLAVILVMALLGNSLVLVVLLRQRRRHRNPLHQFMLNLCLADLVVALFQVLPQLVWDARGRFPGPDFLCRLVKYLQVLGMFASSYMIVAMTMDRHYAICCPLRAHRSGATQRCNHFIVVAWVLSLLLSLPQVFIFSRSEVAPGVYECWGNFAESWGLKAYVTWMTLAVFILPAFTITVCQVRIFKEIHNSLYLKSDCRVSLAAPPPPSRQNSQRAGEGGDNSGKYSVSQDVGAPLNNNPAGSTSYDPESTCQHPPLGPVTATSVSLICNRRSFSADQPADLQQEASSDPAAPSAVCHPTHNPPAFRDGGVSAAMSKTVKMTLVIVIVYSLCWSPFFCVQLWAAWDPNPPQNGVVFTLLMLLASLNSCTNPWIYSAFSSSISPELRLLLFCHSQSQPRCSLPADSTATHNSNY